MYDNFRKSEKDRGKHRRYEIQKLRRRIRDALADLLQTKSLTDISVSELSRKAKISRATFYVHYDNVGDVFDELVGEVMDNVLSFGERFSCENPGCAMHEKPRYCERVRSEKKLAGVVREARFFPSVMALAWEDPDAKTDAATRGIDPVVMRVVQALPDERMPRGCQFRIRAAG